jgi:hypothetical protein
MNINDAVKIACKEPTLLDALTWICVWNSERAIKQAKKNLRDADGKGWDTCFRICLKNIMEKYNQSTHRVPKRSAQSMREFTYESGEEITKAVAGKIVNCINITDSGIDDFLIIKFKDGSALHFRYDYIYDWELKHV